MKPKPSLLLICDNGWGQMRTLALQVSAAGIRVFLVTKVTRTGELRELIPMIPPDPLIRQYFIPRQYFRVIVAGLSLWLVIRRRAHWAFFDKTQTWKWLGPWLRRMGAVVGLVQGELGKPEVVLEGTPQSPSQLWKEGNLSHASGCHL